MSELVSTTNDTDALLETLARIPSVSALVPIIAHLDDESTSEAASRAAISLAGRLSAAEVASVSDALERVITANEDRLDLAEAAKQALWDAGIPYGKTETVRLIDTGPNLALDAVATSPDGIDKDGEET